MFSSRPGRRLQDLFTIGCFENLKHYAQAADVPPAEADAAAKSCRSFEDPPPNHWPVPPHLDCSPPRHPGRRNRSSLWYRLPSSRRAVWLSASAPNSANRRRSSSVNMLSAQMKFHNHFLRRVETDCWPGTRRSTCVFLHGPRAKRNGTFGHLEERNPSGHRARSHHPRSLPGQSC